ncbi:SusD family [Sphingobacterium spiritivorum]|uniref:SusD family n=1 Tax=Sphingobacterium spiritivorum TaxID=258 RepID=A0A380BP31_SPHSI|nr:RagB/SusD family nutrient uptake outer membrane protein [Sphingobacterium spiritivorum]SUJ04562.1 SusD family [Sphingobacterium spiritivorum]
MKRVLKYTIGVVITLIMGSSCNDFINVVPDNVPVLEHAFASRVMAERYLATCYNAMPNFNSYSINPAIMGAGEIWTNEQISSPGKNILRGAQNADITLLNKWDGTSSLWRGISDCNIFIDSIGNVPDMQIEERDKWKAEVTFLKAFYHYELLKRYGPIPIQDKFTPVGSDLETYAVERQPVDVVFDYIINKIDEAMEFLDGDLVNANAELGRVNKVVAKAIRAEVLVYAASPLFNGNQSLSARITNKDGRALFNMTYSVAKWERAAEACKEAIDYAEGVGRALYVWAAVPGVNVTRKEGIAQLSSRLAFSQNMNNPEGLWYYSNSIIGSDAQLSYMPRGWDANTRPNANIRGFLSATQNMAEKYYSVNGVPINEDKTYPYNQRYEVINVTNVKYDNDLTLNNQTIRLHLDREPRFYGNLGFDAGRYFMRSNATESAAFSTFFRLGGNVGINNQINYNATGYAVKKYVNYENTFGASNSMSVISFVPPVIRLADLYLLYAEALNEAYGPGELAFSYIDKVRKRAGLEGVVSSWNKYSVYPSKPSTKEGLREIIKAERTIELAFEGKRFWDLRRWKDATEELSKEIVGSDVNQQNPNLYYRQVVFYSPSFTDRDYFWPISREELRRNQKLVQNYGW